MAGQTAVERWVDEVARMTRPDRVHWCDGSEEEYHTLIEGMVGDGTLIRLNQKSYPGCYLHRSNPSDVARTEHLTFICTSRKEDAGPTNNWMAPKEARERVGKLFEGSMKGRTMYVVPYIMGPAGSPYSKLGVEITDSPYVVANMRIMTRMGKVALDATRRDRRLRAWPALARRLEPGPPLHPAFPRGAPIWSIGSGYGGNALLGKKCLRPSNRQLDGPRGRLDGRAHADHRPRETRTGQVTYIAGAFPSACGKTNLAMLVSAGRSPGYKVWTVGDDIAWMHIGPDGRLWAINPEAGFFGVAPGTSSKTNPNAMAAAATEHDLHERAAHAGGTPWWEGTDPTPPEGLIDWQGNRWTPAREKGRASQLALHRSRGPVPVDLSRLGDARRRADFSDHLRRPPRHARAARVPIVSTGSTACSSGPTMASETTAAATGAVGVVRRDPMAMLPFCGYNMADYFGHWLAMGSQYEAPARRSST